MKLEKGKSCGDSICEKDKGHKTNIERLVTFAEELDEDGTLIPLFLAVLEVGFNSKENGFQEFQIGV